MSVFLAAVLSLPTVVFTVLVGLFVLYGLATLIGAADLELLDGGVGLDDVPDSPLEVALNILGVAGIPLAIVLGVSSIFAWMASMIAMRYLPETGLVQLGAGIGSALFGIGFGSLMLRPFRRIFVSAPAPTRAGIVGRICTVRSLRVDSGAGTAEVDDGGAGFIAEVRCFRENALTRGSKAIVYDYDSEQGVYHVGPIDPSIAESSPVPSGAVAQSETV